MTQIISWDHALFQAINSWQGNPVLDWLFRGLTELGAAYVAVPVGVLLSRLTGARGGWTMAWRALITGTFTGLLSASLKLLVQRPRPLATLPDVHVLGTPLYEYSFPSGHSITAFTVAGLLMALDTRVGMLSLVVACCVGLSRIYVGAHFPTDVVAGALLGFFPSFLAGRVVLKEFRHA